MAFYEDFGKFGDRTAAIEPGGLTLSWNQVDAYADLVAEKIGSRCLVFCFCENLAACMAGYLGFLKHRIVPVMMDAQIDPELAGRLIDRYHPRYLYLPSDKVDTFVQRKPVLEQWWYCLVPTGCEPEYPLYEELALLLTTSGSTGSPKLVRQSYENIQANAASIAAYLELNEDERPVTSLPMNYTYGLSVIHSHTLVGACILLTTSTVVKKDFWDFVKEKGATSLAGVPYTYEMLRQIRFFRMKLPALRTLTQAGGKLPVELHRQFAEHAAGCGRHFVVMYGQTEATARMGYLPWDKALEKAGSMGIPIPGGSFSLIDAQSEPVTLPGEVGELIYTGPNVTLGYAQCGEDLIKGDERHGVLETGDMARFDEDGFYYIVGRKKRFLKLFGSRVNLDETERLIGEAFPQADCACTGEDDRLLIFLTDPALCPEVEAFVTGRLKINLRGVKTCVIDHIPRNESGKIQYRVLTEQADL